MNDFQNTLYHKLLSLGPSRMYAFINVSIWVPSVQNNCFSLTKVKVTFVRSGKTITCTVIGRSDLNYNNKTVSHSLHLKTNKKKYSESRTYVMYQSKCTQTNTEDFTAVIVKIPTRSAGKVLRQRDDKSDTGDEGAKENTRAGVYAEGGNKSSRRRRSGRTRFKVKLSPRCRSVTVNVYYTFVQC